MEAIQEWQLWAAGLLVTLMTGMFGMALTILKEIRNELKQLNVNVVKQEQQLITLDNTVKDHEQRIRFVENKVK